MEPERTRAVGGAGGGAKRRERSHLCESPAEELSNVITHGAGAILSVAATIAMVVAAAGDAWRVVGVAVFGGALVLLYSASTLYHWLTVDPWKTRLQRVDHILIYFLIAGSYTPWLLVNLRGPWGWSLLVVVWSIAITGAALKLFCFHRVRKLSIGLYIGLGWIAAVAGKPLYDGVSTAGLAWLVVGGLFYTFGVIFYVQKRLKFAHSVWHMFVLAGSASHVAAVATGVLPVEV